MSIGVIKQRAALYLFGGLNAAPIFTQTSLYITIGSVSRTP